MELEVGKLYWISAADLHVNAAHQGGVHPATLRYLRENWKGHVNGDNRCQGLPGVLTVTPEHEILDGMHRHSVARELHGDRVQLLCLVTDTLTAPEKSGLYLDLNRTHARHAVDRFVNAALAGTDDPTYRPAAEIAHALNALGLRVAKNGPAETTLRCPTNLLKLHSIGGAPLVASAVTLCRATWPDDQDRFDGRIIEGVGRFLAAHENIDRAAFARKVSKTKCSSIVARARADRDARVDCDLGSGVPALIGRVVRSIYNRGRSTGKAT